MIDIKTSSSRFWLIKLAVLLATVFVHVGNTHAYSNTSIMHSWDSEPAGYTTQADPTTDKVALLIHLAHVQAAIGVSACQRSRDAIKQLKSNGPLGNLLDQFIIGSASGTLSTSASDVFEAAKRLEELGKDLPLTDQQICE